MAIAANRYANKIYSEHPIALWPLDEQAYYLSLIDDTNRLFTNWDNNNAEDRVNFLLNPSFEVNTGGWSAHAAGSIARITTDKFLGTACLEYTKAPGSQVGIYSSTRPRALVGKTYTASAYVKIPAGNETSTLTIYLRSINEAQNAVIGQATQSTTVSSSDGWVRLSVTYTMPASTAFMDMLIVEAVAGTTGQKFLVDAAMIEQSPTVNTYFDGTYGGGAWTGTANFTPSVIHVKDRVNYVTNPSLQTNVTGWSNSSGTVAQITSGGFSGTSFARTTVSTTASNNTYIPGNSRTVTAGEIVTASVYVKAATITKQAQVVLIYNDSSNNWVSQKGGTLTNLTTSWQRLSVTGVIPSGVSYCYMLVTVPTAAAGDTYDMDAALLEFSEMAYPYFDGSLTSISYGGTAYTIAPTWSGTAHASTSVLTQWTANNSPTIPDAPSPFDSDIYSAVTKSNAIAGTVEAEMNTGFGILDLDPNASTVTANMFLYQNPTYINWFKIGIRYTSGGVINTVLSDEIPAPAATGWINLNKTFDVPTSFSGDIDIVVQINFMPSAAGDAASRTVIMNGFSVGQGSSLTCYESLGSTAVDLPSELGFGSIKGIPADQYGVLSDNGYYLIKTNGLLASNDLMSMIYGTDNSTRIKASGTTLPSLIFPGKGMLHNNGRGNEYTMEFWLNIDPQTSESKKIFGPLDSTDGIYVKEGFITLAIGNEIGSHYVGQWYRPMLVHIILKSDNALLLINGEEVVNIDYPRATVELSSGRDWWGVYSYTSTRFFAIDCIAIYPYVVSNNVAKRRFVYGQGTPNIQTLDAAYSGVPTTIDFATAEYGPSVIYPDAQRWDAGYFNNLDATRDYISVPQYHLPVINLQGRDVDEWYADNLVSNNIESPSGTSPKFVTFRPNNTSAEELLSSATVWIDAAKHDGSQIVKNNGIAGPALNAKSGSASSGLIVEPSSHVYLPGVSQNYISVPDEAALDITGDIDLRVKVAMDDWTPASTKILISKENEASQRSYWLALFSDGTLRMYWSTTGSDFPSLGSTVPTGIVNGEAKWVRATLDVDNGAGGKDVKFYLSDNGVDWTQLGSTVTQAGTVSIFSSTTAVQIGAAAGGFECAGKFYRAQIYNGIDGTKVLDVDASVLTDPTARAFYAETGQLVTIVDTSVDVADPKWLDWDGTNYVYLPGTSMANRMDIPDSAALDITGDIDIRVEIAPDKWTPAGNYGIISKINADTAWRWWLTSNRTLQFDWYNSVGSTFAAISTAIVPTSFQDGQKKWLRVTLDVNNGASGNSVTFYTSDDGSTWTQLGATVTAAGVTNIKATADPVFIGVASGSTLPMKFYRAIIKNGINGTTVVDVDTSVVTGSSTSFTALTGQTITILRNTTGLRTTCVDEPKFLFGGNDYLEIADNDLIDFGPNDSMTAIVVNREWSVGQQFARFIAKAANGGSTQNGWIVGSLNAEYKLGNFIYTGASGTYSSYGAGKFWSNGSFNVMGFALDRSNNNFYDIYNGTTGTPQVVGTTTPSVTDLSNSFPLRIGASSDGFNHSQAEIMAAIVFDRVLSQEEISLINQYYNTRFSNGPEITDIYYIDSNGINYQDPYYFNFPSLNILNDQVAAVYGIFEADSNIASERTLISFSNVINGDVFKIVLNTDDVSYYINETQLYTEVITIGTPFLVGLNFANAGAVYGYEVSKFFSSPSSIQVYVGGNGNNTFEGKIFQVGFANNSDYLNIDDSFYDNNVTGGAFAKGINYEVLLDHLTSYTLVPEYEYGKLFLDISVSSEWEEYYPLSYFATYTKDENGEQRYDVDMIQLNIGYITVESTGVWTYQDLKDEFPPPNDYADLAAGVYTNYIGLKNRNTSGGAISTAESSLKGYLTFQPIATGANAPLSSFTYEKTIDPSHIIYVDQENTVLLPEKAFDTKFAFVDDMLVFPPKSKPFDDYAMVIHLQIGQRSILRNPLKIRKLEITSKGYNENGVVEQKTSIGTKFGGKIYPYVQQLGTLNNAGNKPFSISKETVPYLYSNKKMGIGVRNEAVQDIVPVSDTQIFIPINQSGAIDQLVSIVQFMIKPEFDDGIETVKLLKIDYRDGSLVFSMNKDGSTTSTIETYIESGNGYLIDGGSPSTPSYSQGFDSSIPNASYTTSVDYGTSVLQTEAITDVSYSLASGLFFYQNGRYVPSPILTKNEYTMIGIVFPNGIDFGQYSSGGITLFGGARFNNISYYLANGLGAESTLTTRVWQDVLDENGVGATLWSYWTGSEWQTVYLLGQTSSYTITPEDIYDAYVGTNGNIIDDGYGLLVRPSGVKLVTDASWSLISGKPV